MDAADPPRASHGVGWPREASQRHGDERGEPGFGVFVLIKTGQGQFLLYWFSPYYSCWTWTQDQHVFGFDLKRILLKISKKGGFFSMAACRARTLSWRRGDDGVWLGQSGLLGCTKRLGRDKTTSCCGLRKRKGREEDWTGAGWKEKKTGWLGQCGQRAVRGKEKLRKKRETEQAGKELSLREFEFKQNIFYFWFNSWFESNSIQILTILVTP
jgi:hypothetical protein